MLYGFAGRQLEIGEEFDLFFVFFILRFWHGDSEAVTRCKAIQVPLRAMGSLIPASMAA